MNTESSWNECIETNASLRITPDLSKAASLIDTALGRIRFLSGINITEDNANYLFENYYSSVLELMHARVLVSGFKVSNHICLGYYLRDILGKNELFRLFDDCRANRNSLVYYGRKMDFETAKQKIEKCKMLISQLSDLLEKQTKLSK